MSAAGGGRIWGGIDVRATTVDQIGEHSSGAARHRPSHMPVPGVEVHIAVPSESLRCGEGAIAARGRSLGHDLAVPRRIVLIQYEETDVSRPVVDSGEVVRQIQAVFDSADDLIAPLARMVIAVATPEGPNHSRDRCGAFVAAAESRGLQVRVGIGSSASGIAALNVSARDAFDALQLGPVAHPDRTIHEIEQALSVVPIDSRTRLTDGLLAPLLTDREWQALRATLIAWGDSAFNITRAADRLHVHRNTLIYRLDKVARILRRSLDEPGLAVALYGTCVMDQLGRPPTNR